MLVDMKGKEYKKTFNDVKNEFRLISSGDEIFSKWKRTIVGHKHKDLICPENGVPFKTLDGWTGNEGLSHEFFKILATFSEDEIDDLTAYILNKRPTKSAATREVPKVNYKDPTNTIEGARNLVYKKVGREEKLSCRLLTSLVQTSIS